MTKKEELEGLRRELARAQARRLAAENAREAPSVIRALTETENALLDRLYPIEDSLSDEEPTMVMAPDAAAKMVLEMSRKRAEPVEVALNLDDEVDLGPVEDVDVCSMEHEGYKVWLADAEVPPPEQQHKRALRGLAQLWESWWTRIVARTFGWF